MNIYFVTYDIVGDKRRTRVYQNLRGWGDHLQYSVFRCILNQTDLAKLRAAISQLINHHEDQVLIVDLGPADGRGATATTSIGLPYTQSGRRAIIILAFDVDWCVR